MFMQAAIAYAATVIVFFAIDFVWLSYAAKTIYQREIGPLLLSQFNLPVAAGFYVFYVVGIVVFAVLPALNSGSWLTALILGGLLGLIAYGTYDLTNLATLKGWTVKMAVIDMTWGMVLTGFSAMAGFFLTRLVSGNG
jgi:uncharacterized membrane protein